MINSDELIFAVDENNQPIEPVERRKAHAEGIWHRTNDIAVVNFKNEILCTKRSMQKEHSPGSWDATFGGHVLAGMDDLESALQELKEESGLEANKNELDFIAIVKYSDPSLNNNEFRYLYIYRWNGSLNDLKLEKEEIDEAKWIAIEVVKNNKDNRKEWTPMPYLDELLRIL